MPAGSPPDLSLARPEDRAAFQVTTFARDLSFPTSMLSLADGSLVVATNVGPSLFAASTGTLLRFTDVDGDGVADGTPVTLAQGLPGLITSIRRIGSVVVVLSSRTGEETITLLRVGPTADAPLSPAGSLRFRIPEGFEHSTYALALRRSPSQPGAIEVFFNLGAKSNAAATTERVGLQGDGLQVRLDPVELEADSIQRLILTPSGFRGQFVASVDLIARGLRNAAGMTFAANGDLYLQDNGIDDRSNGVSLSADELNCIAAADIGRLVPDFGFPGTYVDAATGNTVSDGREGITAPVLTFRPVGDERSEGAVELAEAPWAFGAGFRQQIFTTFYGEWGRGGAANQENPVVLANPKSGERLHFIPNQLLGHPYGLLSTPQTLFLTDLDHGGSLANNRGGVLYRVARPVLPAPTLAIKPRTLRLQEGSTGVTAFTFTVRRRGDSSGAASVDWTVEGVGVNPTDAWDFENSVWPGGTVSFAPGERTRTLTVPVVADAVTETIEQFRVALSQPSGADLDPASAEATGTIVNDDRGAWVFDWRKASPLGDTPGVLLAQLSLPSPRPAEPVLRLTALRVDLTTPGLSLTVSDRISDWEANSRETLTETPRGFIERHRLEGTPVVAAINTSFFTLTDGWKAVPTDLKGLAVDQGVLVSPAENGVAALLLDPITGARIEQLSASTAPDPAGLTLAVSGGSFSEGIVLRDGVVMGASDVQNARSGLGLSRDQRFLTLLTVDRSLRSFAPSYWGATFQDVGRLLAGLGSSDGMNLDGGGSSQLACWDAGSGTTRLLNTPLGGLERFVGTSLGVVVAGPEA